MGNLHVDGNTVVTQDMAEWLQSGTVASCLELRAHLLQLSKRYGSNARPMTWPTGREAPIGGLGGRYGDDGISIRHELTEQEAESVHAYYRNDRDLLQTFLPRLCAQLKLPPLEWDVAPMRTSVNERSKHPEWIGRLRGAIAFLRASCWRFAEQLERAAIDRGEVPWGWDGAICGWPDAPIGTVGDLWKYMEQFSPWIQQEFDVTKVDPSWTWRVRKVIHAALDQFDVACNLKRTACPASPDESSAQLAEILTYLRVLAESEVAKAVEPKWSKARSPADWRLILKYLGVEDIEEDAFRRRRQEGIYRQSPDSTKRKVRLALDDLPSTYSDKLTPSELRSKPA